MYKPQKNGKKIINGFVKIFSVHDKKYILAIHPSRRRKKRASSGRTASSWAYLEPVRAESFDKLRMHERAFCAVSKHERAILNFVVYRGKFYIFLIFVDYLCFFYFIWKVK